VSDVQVISRSPSVIEYYIDKESSKSIEVRGKFVGSVADGYIAEQLEINPQTIKISGPEKVIEQVDYAYVEINREDVDSTLEFSTAYQLIDVDGNVITDDSITPERDTVDVILPIKASKEVALAVDIIPGGGAASENVVVSIEPSAITIIGDADMLEGINKIVLGSIDLSEVDQSYEATYQIALDNGVQNQTGTTEAKVTVEIKGLETRDIIINNFSCTNVPDGYDADIFTKSLTVKVRADSDTIDQIASTNIRAVADLSEYSGNEGDFTVPVKIYISDFADAGVVGSYSIYISISESSE
jgi:YbbR domain-containing protein